MTSEEILNDIDELRGMMTGCQSAAKAIAAKINRGAGGREVALAYTAMQEVQSWLRYAQDELKPTTISNEEGV